MGLNDTSREAHSVLAQSYCHSVTVQFHRLQQMAKIRVINVILQKPSAIYLMHGSFFDTIPRKFGESRKAWCIVAAGPIDGTTRDQFISFLYHSVHCVQLFYEGCLVHEARHCCYYTRGRWRAIWCWLVLWWDHNQLFRYPSRRPQISPQDICGTVLFWISPTTLDSTHVHSCQGWRVSCLSPLGNLAHLQGLHMDHGIYNPTRLIDFDMSLTCWSRMILKAFLCPSRRLLIPRPLLGCFTWRHTFLCSKLYLLPRYKFIRQPISSMTMLNPRC